MTSTLNFKIIALTETWLKTTPDSLLSLDGYKHEFKNRQGQNGGVLLCTLMNLLHTV